MASEVPENAFVQPGGTPTWSADGWHGAAENQTSHTEHSEQHIQEPTISIDQAPHSPSDAASNDEDSGEYDPESVTLTAAPAPAPAVERSASASSFRPSKKPKTTGGFIVDSSDDDDDAPIQNPTPAPNGLKPTPSAAPSWPPTHSPIPQAPLQQSPLQQAPLQQAPLQQAAVPQNIASHTHAAQASNGPATPAVASNVAATVVSRSRLPADIVGVLEDRIKDDPRGDLEAWLALIDEHKRRHKIEDARAAYDRFLKVFPQAAEIWVAYLDMELSLENYSQAEEIFGRTLLSIPNVQLWTAYLNYIRRRNDLNDPSNRARQTVSQAYDFVLNTIGQDRDAGGIWQDYIQFVKTGPGQIGGGSWQDQQKMDILRKAYQRAICIPMANLNFLWKEYDQFELGLNKMTGRKFLQERSPSYMTARSANTHLENITRGLQRTTLPRLPPAPGFDGDQEYLEQVELWKAWIAWEKDDPLVLKADDPDTYRQRVLHVYKQALMALRFWPEMWVDAAEWCFENDVVGRDGQDLGLQFLIDGAAANPESSLLALKHADRIESTQSADEDDVGKVALAQAVRAPFDKVLDTLYGMIKKLKDREQAAISKIEEDAALDDGTTASLDLDDDDDEGEIKEKVPGGNTKKDKIKAVQDGFAVQIQMLSQQISYLWVALARAFRRLQGQGQAKSTPPSGVRGVFTEARQKGRLTSDVYLAIAQIEWDIYQDNVGTKIFDRGAKLFPEQEHFIVEYLKHLHARRDFTNARVVFSQAVQRFKEKPELIPKLKPLYAYFHGYEAKFGELSQVKELERQMAELFPGDPKVAHFAARFSTDKFNPITARAIISPAKQMRPKTVMQSVEHHSASLRSSPHPVTHNERSPRPQFLPVINSPKRPFQADDQDDQNQPRKLARGASPLKGAAGRRLDQQRRAQHNQGASTHVSNQPAIPSDIGFLLGVIPNARYFHDNRFNPDSVLRLIKETPIPDSRDWKAQHNESPASRVHAQQTTMEYPQFGYSGRDSPSFPGRPASPYSAINRAPPQASAPYRNSPLRPGSSGSYEPPPAVYQAPGQIQYAPIAQTPAPENAAYANWQGGYVPTPTQQYGLPPQQAPQYGGFY
ncbi:hypothetical protein F5B20DRAFT_557755 [Whalleya microplaca]|nr:hypothetical protein F5B20DRAFT_557755 [Whalleya microplaca]